MSEDVQPAGQNPTPAAPAPVIDQTMFTKTIRESAGGEGMRTTSVPLPRPPKQ